MKEETSHSSEQLISWFKSSALLLLVVAGLWQLVTWMGLSNTLPIKHVRIEGSLNYVTQEEVSEALSGVVETGYFSMNTDEIVKQVTDIEWVKQARIRRVWPDTIVLSVVEQHPAATWNKTKLLNADGEVFEPIFDKASLNLPSLSGINSDSKSVLAELQRIDLSVKSIGLSVKQLALAEHGSWDAVMSNGVRIKAGNQLPEQKISKSLMLLSSLDGDLLEHLNEVDLRYPNGVAVTWKDGYVLGKSTGKELVVKNNQLAKG
jgi:cell division protein FtsQ